MLLCKQLNKHRDGHIEILPTQAISKGGQILFSKEKRKENH